MRLFVNVNRSIGQAYNIDSPDPTAQNLGIPWATHQILGRPVQGINPAVLASLRAAIAASPDQAGLVDVSLVVAHSALSFIDGETGVILPYLIRGARIAISVTALSGAGIDFADIMKFLSGAAATNPLITASGPWLTQPSLSLLTFPMIEAGEALTNKFSAEAPLLGYDAPVVTESGLVRLYDSFVAGYRAQRFALATPFVSTSGSVTQLTVAPSGQPCGISPQMLALLQAIKAQSAMHDPYFRFQISATFDVEVPLTPTPNGDPRTVYAFSDGMVGTGPEPRPYYGFVDPTFGVGAGVGVLKNPITDQTLFLKLTSNGLPANHTRTAQQERTFAVRRQGDIGTDSDSSISSVFSLSASSSDAAFPDGPPLFEF